MNLRLWSWIWIRAETHPLKCLQTTTAAPSLPSSYPATQHTESSDHHFMNKERERRGKMARMYSILHSFLPNLSSDNQASREKIVTETIELIKRLEDNKSRLEKAKAGLATSNASSSVTVCASNHVAVFQIRRPHDDRTTLTTARILEVFDQHSADILAASVVVNEGMVTVSVTAAVVNGDRSEAVERIKRDLLL